ncbi:MAG: methyl-accepting chemotaxis protein [Gallionella sp.]
MTMANLKVGTRLGLGFGAVVMMFAVTFLGVGLMLSDLTRDAKQIDEETLPFVMVVDEMDLSRSEVQQFLTDVSATHDRAAFKEAEDSAKLFLGGVEKFKEMYRRENDVSSLKQIEAIDADFNKFYSSGKVMAEAYITKGLEAGNLLMKGTDTAIGFDRDSETLAADLNKFRDQQVAEAHKITADTVRAARSTLSMMIWSSLAAALLAAVLGWWIIRSLLRQLGGEPAYAAEVVSKIANGDLTVEVRTKSNDNNSMLFAVKDMVDKLTGIVTEVRGSTDSITTASQEIAQGNTDLSQRTEEQASSLEETASSMEELTSTVRQNAENAKQANQLAVNASDIAVKGGQVVGEVVDTMSSISTSSKKIVDIISVIDGIAFQTNILALNAAVEAARAGEQGRGFAVVASEVRNLAQRSAAAAKEIKTLIGDSVEKVDIGAKQVEQAGATMNEIVQAVKRVTDIMAEIAAASNEQSSGIEQVNQAITQMDEVTQQNAALVEQAAAAAEAMQGQSEVLMQAVSIFKLEGRTMTRAVAKPAAKPAAMHVVAHHGPSAPAKSTRKLAKTKEDKDGEWKEF